MSLGVLFRCYIELVPRAWCTHLESCSDQLVSSSAALMAGGNMEYSVDATGNTARSRLDDDCVAESDRHPHRFRRQDALRSTLNCAKRIESE
jgi:hypothetical protein